MKYLRGIFNDGLTRAAGAIFVLVCIVVLFSNYSDLPEQHPLFGVFVYILVPILFVAGGIVFVFAILRLLK
ncbi:MAG: hypothetical protein PHR56_05390 [Dehalococcoidales bacterium]|nr:hypothetical protein [Dehalococcoidales bacterium]